MANINIAQDICDLGKHLMTAHSILNEITKIVCGRVDVVWLFSGLRHVYGNQIAIFCLICLLFCRWWSVEVYVLVLCTILFVILRTASMMADLSSESAMILCMYSSGARMA